MCFSVFSAENFVVFCDKLEQNYPAFLEKRRGVRGEGKPGADVRLFSREKKFFPFPREPFHFNRIAGECYLLNRGFAVVLPQKQLALI